MKFCKSLILNGLKNGTLKKLASNKESSKLAQETEDQTSPWSVYHFESTGQLEDYPAYSYNEYHVYIYDAIKEHIHSIIDTIRVILERTPPELAADIIRDGIYLTGGSSSIRNIPELITRETRLKVNTFDSPSESVARGLARLIKESQYRSLAYTNSRR